MSWGDYSVRTRRGKGAVSATRRFARRARPSRSGAVGRPSHSRWRSRSRAAARIPSRVQTTAVLDGDEWVINGEKIFVTTGCRAEGVDHLGHPRPICGPRRDQVVPGREGQHPASSLGKKRRSSAFAQTTPPPTCSPTAAFRESNLLGGNEGILEKNLGRLPGCHEDVQHDAARCRGHWYSEWPRPPSISRAIELEGGGFRPRPTAEVTRSQFPPSCEKFQRARGPPTRLRS